MILWFLKVFLCDSKLEFNLNIIKPNTEAANT